MTSPPEIELVVASEEHREAIFRISAQTWEGQDYLTSLWDTWLRKGDFYAIVHQDEIVGCIKASPGDAGEVLLEGLRIDPGRQSQHLASAAFSRLVSMMEGRRPRLLRFATSDENRASHHLGEKHGFSKVAAFHFRYLDDLEDWEDPGRQVPAGLELETPGPKMAREILNFLEQDPNWSEAHGLLTWGWEVHRCTEDLVKMMLAEGVSLVVREKGRLRGCLLAAGDRQYPGRRALCWVFGEEAVFDPLFLRFMRQGRAAGAPSVEAKTVSREVAGFFEERGLVRHELVEGLWVFEKELG